MLLAEVVLDVGGEHVAGRAYAVLDHEAAEGDHCDLGGAAAYVHDHVALGSLHVEAYSQGGRHGLEDEVDVAAAGVLGGVAHGPDLHFRGSGRDAHHHLEVGVEEIGTLAAGLLDEGAEHGLRGIEVGNHAVTERTYRLEAGVDLLVHELGPLSDGDDPVCIVVQRYDARFVQNYLPVLVNDCVRGSEIYSKFLVQKRKCHIGIEVRFYSSKFR